MTQKYRLCILRKVEARGLILEVLHTKWFLYQIHSLRCRRFMRGGGGGGGGSGGKTRWRRGERGGNACRKGLSVFVSTAAHSREILIGLF
jgi:hypothetical protein